MTNEELQTWWSYWTPEHFEADERDTNGGKYRPLHVCVTAEQEKVLGYCPHGVNLDREFCPDGCRV